MLNKDFAFEFLERYFPNKPYTLSPVASLIRDVDNNENSRKLFIVRAQGEADDYIYCKHFTGIGGGTTTLHTFPYEKTLIGQLQFSHEADLIFIQGYIVTFQDGDIFE